MSTPQTPQAAHEHCVGNVQDPDSPLIQGDYSWPRSNGRGNPSL
eukprot:CAMPEP_0117545106 /NCGR_PEP_ID=MMETSP0784-20121206/45923_1 /TAXON_ID=39447 /ORGANISM="" /LENGTH=43 /DNA_ID= /DNA_START= /DNA_END= /DNA_ORIENTATION=